MKLLAVTVALVMSFAVGVLLAVSGTGGVNQGPAEPNDGKREFTISGCLLRSGYASYQIDDAKIDAIDGKPAPASSGPADAIPKKWSLQGGGNLGPRVGERVQVVGRSEWQPSSKNAQDEPPDKGPSLDVKSVKSIASSCT